MKNIIEIIKNDIGTFDPFTETDSYIVANRIEKILREKGFVMVENMKDAEDYFAKKYGEPEQVYETYEEGFDMLIDNVNYNIKLYKYAVGSDKIYSVLVSEL